MSEQIEETVDVTFSSDQKFYCVPSVSREGGLWLSVENFPLPVKPEWKYPNVFGVAIMRGRNYYRHFSRMSQIPGASKPLSLHDALIEDWRDAAWWTPGLEEAWMECQGLHDAIAQHERDSGRSEQTS